MLNRRSFLGVGAAALAAAGCTTAASSEAVGFRKRPSGSYTFGKVPFKLGIAGYTYHKCTLDQTLAALKRLDVHYLCVKDFHLSIKSTPAQIAEFKRKCADAGVVGYGVGPIYMDSEDAARRAFDYAAALGVNLVVGVPNKSTGEKGKRSRIENRALCEFLSGLCDQYRINYAIHNHGPDMPLLFPVAEAVWKQIEDLSPRMGFCLDVGHQFRDGRDPVAAIRTYHKRIYDLHIKNVTFDPVKNLAQPMPRGDMDMFAIVKALVAVGYSGCCSLEYERDFTDNLAGVAESIGYFRGLMDAAAT